MIVRPDYTNAIKPFVDLPIVKILVGVRRCGKTTILEMISEMLKENGVSADNIIARNYGTIGITSDYVAVDMYNDIESAVSGKGHCYLLLDELQEISAWEKSVNSLLENCDVDIYVTGSNSKLMSSEISTYLSGRCVTIPVYTLSFQEYLNFKEYDRSEARTAFDEYILFGGFPLIGISNLDTRSAYQIVEDIYASVVSNDITKRHQIRNTELFTRVVKYIIDNVGNAFSASSIIKYLKKEKRSLTVDAIYNYLKWLTEASVIYPCQRYDLQAQTVLKTQEKFYLSDISFKHSLSGFDRKALSAILENVVFLEMKRRGYEVFIGKNNTKEIGFLAMRKDERLYVQVCAELPPQSFCNNLMEVKDHYHKYVVCCDPLASGNDNGIEIVHIANFLLRENW